MFHFRATVEGDVRVDVAFTDSAVDLQGLREEFPDVLARVEGEVGVPLARLTQVHGAQVHVVDAPMGLDEVPEGDALVTATRGLGLMVRVADCVPVVLADAGAGVVAAVHAGRQGMVLEVAARAVEVMRSQGATDIRAWIGPHVCGACYEVPQELQDEVVSRVQVARATTSWGTPSLDLGAGVRSQLEEVGVDVTEVGGCTREDLGLHSYRRDGAAAGRFAGLVWMS